MANNPKSTKIIRWIAYITSTLLFARGALIFIGNLNMFLSPDTSSLPAKNWVFQGIHLLLLIGYLLIFNRPRIACIIIAISSFALYPFTAGKNAAINILIALIPVYLIGYLWFRDRNRK